MATQENRSMVSEVSICNQALLWLGESPITSLDDDSRRAIWMKNNYPFIRDSVVEERTWTFATVRAKSTVTDLDAWERMYVHPQPTSWISVFRVYRDIQGQVPSQWATSEGWRMEGGNVLSKDSTVYMWGLERVTDTGRFSPTFVQALAARIAADAAVPLTENRQLQADMWNLYQVKLSEAAARDGQQGTNEKIQSNRFVDARASVYGR